MLRSCLFASIFALAAATQAAAQIISYRYDGVYVGSAELSPDLSDASCPPLPLNRLEIKNGILRAYDDNSRQTVKGFVTGSGFFNSDYYFYPGKRATPFEGRIDKWGRLTGGVIDGGCAWVVELSKTS